jgi:uncharacterized protein (DUF2062 family)
MAIRATSARVARTMMELYLAVMRKSSLVRSGMASAVCHERYGTSRSTSGKHSLTCTGVAVGVTVGVIVLVGVAVLVAVTVAVWVGVGVIVGVFVATGVFVGVGVWVGVGGGLVTVGVGVGDGLAVSG